LSNTKTLYKLNSPIPAYVQRRVDELYGYAVENGVLSYIARNAALKYVLENEYPELLFKFNEPLPMKGYARCIALWSRAGLVKPISKREALKKAISSPLFDQILLNNGVSYERINTVKNEILKQIDKYRGSLRQVLHQIVSTVEVMDIV